MAETVKQTIQYVADTRDAERGLKALQTEERNLIREFRDGNRTYDETRDALKQVARGYQDSEEAANSFRRSIRALSDEQEAANRIQRRQDTFDATSRNVALAGDVQSNLGAIQGLAGVAGAGGASQAIGIGGELVALVEELPRLKEAARGLPETVSAAAQAIGFNSTSGMLGAIGAVAVVAVAAKLALDNYIKAKEQEAALLTSQLNAQFDLNEQIAQGLVTSEQAREELDRLNQSRESRTQSLAEAEERFAQFEASVLDTPRLFGLTIDGFTTSVVNGFEALANLTIRPFVEVYNLLPGVNVRFEDLFDSIDEGIDNLILGATTNISPEGREARNLVREQQNIVNEQTGQIDALSTALEENAFAAADAAAAEEERAEAAEETAQRNAESALAQAQAQTQLNALNREALDFTTEELQARRESLNERKQQIEEEVAALRASGDTSDVVQAQIEALTNELGNVNSSLETLSSSAVREAAAANTAREAQDALSESTQSYAASAQDAAGSIAMASEALQKSFGKVGVKGSTSGGSSGGFSTGSSSGGGFNLGSSAGNIAARAERETNSDLQRIYEDRQRMIIDFNNRESEIRRQALFDQQQTLERFEFDEDRLLAKGNFTQAFDRRVEAVFTQQQAGERFRFEANERQLQQLQEMQRLSNELKNIQATIRLDFNGDMARFVTAQAQSAVNGVLVIR